MEPLERASRPNSKPELAYQQRCAEFGARRDWHNRRSYRNANLSLVLIAAALLCGGLWLWRATPALLGAAIVLGVGFVVSFIHHGRVDLALRRYTELFAINDEGLLRLRRDWERLPLRQPPEHNRNERNDRRGLGIYGQIFAPFAFAAVSGAAESDSGQGGIPDIAHDLDLLGHASLQHLLNTPATPVGLATLRDWLLAPAPPAVARGRQAAVAELAPLNDMRDQLALRGRLMGGAQADYERFLRWAERSPWLPARPLHPSGFRWLLLVARVLPLATLLLAGAQVAGLLTPPLWLIGIVVGLALSQTIGRAVDREIDEVAERQQVFATYAELFQMLSSQPFGAPELRRLQGELAAAGLRADRQMRRLSRLMALADLRGWMFFYPIQLATLWNVHVLWLLDGWRRAAGGSARRWLAALGEFEALAALAALVHDHPNWTFPELIDLRSDAKEREVIADQSSLRTSCDLVDPVLDARNLGHPLLRPDVCVGNDVSIGPPGRFLLVTGSNMSGKSTLLRAIGLNVALAQAGGPVCAEMLRLCPVTLATSMRVQDSLEQGMSYFMAELQRLKQVVDAAEQAHTRAERTLLFLLDEILHGTNTSERQIAARRIILHLLGLGATGAVSTHDLTLADAPELAAASDMVHFTEEFARGPEGLTMRFDYRLRPGIATSTNALKLMEMIGLPSEETVDTRRET
jgi:MutS domain V